MGTGMVSPVQAGAGALARLATGTCSQPNQHPGSPSPSSWTHVLLFSSEDVELVGYTMIIVIGSGATPVASY